MNNITNTIQQYRKIYWIKIIFFFCSNSGISYVNILNTKIILNYTKIQSLPNLQQQSYNKIQRDALFLNLIW